MPEGFYWFGVVRVEATTGRTVDITGHDRSGERCPGGRVVLAEVQIGGYVDVGVFDYC